MAAALLLVAIEQAMILLDRPMELWRLNGIGVLLALAVAANLTVAVPATALVAVLIAMYVRNRFRLDALIDRLIVTAVVVSVALLIFPLMNAGRVHFYVGARSIVDSATSLAFACFWRPLNLFMHTPLHSPFEAFTSAMGKGLWILIPGVACVAVWFDRKRDRMLLLGVTLGAIALIVVLHLLTNGPYPERRTGLYFIPLMTLLAGVAGQRLGKAALVPACFVLVLFAGHWNVQYYDEWIFDSGNRQLMRYIRDHAPLDGRKVTIGATFPLDHGVQFYRHKYKLDWLQTPAMHKGADAHYDVYLLTLADLKLIDKYHLIRRKEHPVSHVIVAVPAASPLRP